MERLAGIEPGVFSLENCGSTIELHPHGRRYHPPRAMVLGRPGVPTTQGI